MMTEDETLAMARDAAERTCFKDGSWVYAEGKMDKTHQVQSALAAIRAMKERNADYQTRIELQARREGEADMRERKDAAYRERNQLVRALASIYPSGIARTSIEGWDDEWHGCVYIDTPAGQLSWHYHDSQAEQFADLPPYQRCWDGHDTPEKYRRLAAIRALPLSSGDPQPAKLPFQRGRGVGA